MNTTYEGFRANEEENFFESESPRYTNDRDLSYDDRRFPRDDYEYNDWNDFRDDRRNEWGQDDREVRMSDEWDEDDREVANNMENEEDYWEDEDMNERSQRSPSYSPAYMGERTWGNTNTMSRRRSSMPS